LSSAAPQEQIPPLAGDPARQAIDSILGYDYQIVRTVEAWLQLRPDEKIYIECAEDYDVVGPAGAVATQIKNSPSTITLNSEDVRDAVRNFWSHRERNAKREQVSMRFLTRGGVGKEQRSKLGAEKGIELWRMAAAGDTGAGRLVADHLIAQGGPDSFLSFLRDSDAARLRNELFFRIEWVTDELSIDAARLSVSRLAVNMGAKTSTPPIVSERAVPALLEHCRRAAGEREAELRSLALADAQLVFANHTSLPVPITNQLATAMGLVAAVAGSGPIAMSFAAVFDGELPELPVERLPRTEFLLDLTAQARASGCTLIVGSEGEGKSTSANMLARALDPAAYWMDLRGGDEQVSAAAIENAIVIARGARLPGCVVLDDVPAAQGVSDALWGRLRALIDSCRRAGVALIMTSKGVPVDMVDPKFRAAGVAVAPVPRIGEQELIDYLRSQGCDAELAESWARVTLAHTGSGHPKLVHLAALELRDRKWIAADAAEFVAAPRSVEEARASARQSATRAVPQPDRNLLFALSLATAAFERGVALEVGRRLGMKEPGAVFDRLTGRWIESRGRIGYKATPLLNGQAQQLWAPEQVRRMHAVLLDSFMATKSIRLDQAMDLFLHAFQSQDARRFGKFVATMAFHIEQTEGLAEALELVVHVGSVDDAPAIPFDESASMLFRFLQFRVARARRPEMLPDIARRWKWEIEHLKEADHREFSRALRGMTIAMAVEGSFTASTIIEAMRDAALLETLGIETPAITARELDIPAANPADVIDTMHMLFLVAQSNFGSAHRVDDMLESLTPVPSDFRRRLLDAFDLPLARAGFSMFDRALVTENQLDQADWPALAETLARAAKVGREWGAAGFQASAARVLSIVLAEHVGDHGAAQQALEEATTAGSSPVIKEQMANLAYGRGDYEGAVRLWSESLQGGDGAGAEGVHDPFAMRRAAIACGRLGRFGEAAEWLERAALTAGSSLKIMPAALFQSDASYCWFKQGDARRALRAASKARSEVLAPMDAEAQPRLFLAQRCLGHVLFWMRKEVLESGDNLQEPIVGMASSPEVDLQALRAEPATSPDMIALAIVELCLLLRIDETWTVDAVATVEASAEPFVAARYRAGVLRALLAQGAYSQAAAEIHELYEAMLRMGLAGRREQAGLPPDPAQTPDAAYRKSMSDVPAYALALTLALATMNNVNRPRLLKQWRDSLPSGESGAFMAALTEEVARRFEVSGAEAMERARQGEDWLTRVGASAVALADDARSPRETAQAQWVLAHTLLGSGARPFVRAGLNELADAFSRQWQRRLVSPALLANPRLTVPMLEQVIASQEPPTRKILSLAVAGANACSDRVPDFIRATLEDAANQDGAREMKALELAARAATDRGEAASRADTES